MRKENHLVLIECGKLTNILLDNKNSWEFGRLAEDIRVNSPTVSRQHGRFENIDGIWCYYDKKGKNGTAYNGKKIALGMNGRIKPIMLKHRDILIFGGSDRVILSDKIVWAIFLEKSYETDWTIVDTKAVKRITVASGTEISVFNNLDIGAVIEKEEGIAIYMGDTTYLHGNISIVV